MNVDKIMSQPAICCRDTETLNVPAQLMWECDCGAIPVIDADGLLVGMVTDRDICMSAYTQGKLLQDIPVRHAMARNVYVCRSNDSVSEVEKVLGERQVRRVPVVDDAKRPIGIVSLSDIARHAESVGRKNGMDREVVRTMAAVCRPHRAAATPLTA
jgi:predicted transcriptional regulator